MSQTNLKIDDVLGGIPASFSSRGHMYVDVFDTVSLRWRTVTPAVPLEAPSARCHHTAALVGDTAYVWGGDMREQEYCNVLYAFDVNVHRWSKPGVSGDVPQGRIYHSACVVLGKDMFIHGGLTMARFTNDFYKLDTSTMVWASINTRGSAVPLALACHSAATIGTKIFVFGGIVEEPHCSHCYNSVQVFDTETNVYGSLTPSTTQPLPEGRQGHSAFAYNGEMYIFGGTTTSMCSRCKQRKKKMENHCTDLWKFNPETFSWKEVKPKGNDDNNGPLRMIDGCCCIVGDRVILFGGGGILRSWDELFVLDLSPSLKTLCKLAVIQHNLDQSELPHHLRWELEAMTKYKL